MMKTLNSPEYGLFQSLLIKARESAGLTQAAVAIKLKRPQSFVAKYEGGERRLDVIEFILVCDAINVDPINIISNICKVIEK